MKDCSVCKKLEIVPGCLDDYKRLAHYHYRDCRCGPFAAIFALKYLRQVVGVIVYSMPTSACQLRNIATNNYFVGYDRKTRLALINKLVRRISRVIIEPRFRGLGLASRLVRETMPQMNVPVVEAMAVMGWVNPFFERAGMTAYTAGQPARCVQLVEAFSFVGIEEKELINSEIVQRKIEKLRRQKADFIERQIRCFLQSYGARRNMHPGIERTRYVLSKLTERPVYYIWFNKEIKKSNG